MKKKGRFKTDRAGKHEILYLEHEGMQTHIQVGVGHHHEDVGATKQSEYARQLKMANAAFLAGFVNCSKSRDDYIRHLIDTGELDS